MHHAFISYASPDRDLTLNLRSRLGDYGIQAWVYERDKTIGDQAWSEIEQQLRAARVVFIMLSTDSPSARGQQREFEMCLDRVRATKDADFLVPLILDDDLQFGDLPEELSSINGERLDAFNIRSVTESLAHRYFPTLVGDRFRHGYVCPTPGDWLQIAKFDARIESGFSVGDVLYFRQLSPMGLFECYCPRTGGLTWIDRSNLRPADSHPDSDDVPRVYQVGTLVEMYGLGWAAWCKTHPEDAPPEWR